MSISFPALSSLSTDELINRMVGYLFDGSFKKQIKFQQFVRQYKEGETIITLEPVPAQSTAELQPQPSTDPRQVHETFERQLWLISSTQYRCATVLQYGNTSCVSLTLKLPKGEF